ERRGEGGEGDSSGRSAIGFDQTDRTDRTAPTSRPRALGFTKGRDQTETGPPSDRLRLRPRAAAVERLRTPQALVRGLVLRGELRPRQLRPGVEERLCAVHVGAPEPV